MLTNEDLEKRIIALEAQVAMLGAQLAQSRMSAPSYPSYPHAVPYHPTITAPTITCSVVAPGAEDRIRERLATVSKARHR